jgi:hypothetical protein
MIAIAKTQSCKRFSPCWNDRFLELLPAIQDQAEFAFRRVPSDAREELVAETIASAYGMFRSLCRQGNASQAFATPLCKFAVRRVRDGRRLGSQTNGNDLLSTQCQRRNGVVVQPLYREEPGNGGWREIVVEDWRSGPDEIAATRIDFAAWLKTLSRRDRKIAERLAVGESTGTVARTFRISSGRISQLRREFFEGWHKFVGELAEPGQPALASV